MVGSVGLAAAYGGYQGARLVDQKIAQGDVAVTEAQEGQQATEALGKALPLLQQMLVPGAQPMSGQQMPGAAGGMPNAGAPPQQGSAPQAPPPGQSSQPMQQGPQPQMLGAPPPPSDPTMQIRPQADAGSVGDRFGGLPGGGAAPPPPMPQQPPQMAQGGGQPPQGMPQRGAVPQQPQQGPLNLHTVMGAVIKANPGAPPQVIAMAVAKALPLMTAQSQMDYKQLMTQLAGARIQETAQHHVNTEATGAKNADTRATAVDNTKGYRDARLGQIDYKQKYTEMRDFMNRDAQMQRIKQAQERLDQGADRGDVVKQRAIIDAEHKRAMEIISSGKNALGVMDPDERKALLAEEDKRYNESILKLKGMQRNGAPQAAAPQQSAPAQAAPAQGAAAARPQAVNPKTGEKVEFDGKAWVPVTAQ